MKLTPRQLDNFWSKVNKTNECWVWQRGCTKTGHGRVRLNDKNYLTHRISFILKHGPIADDICVLHKCDNPPCVNPYHLFLGSRIDNIKDMDLKGRRAINKGEQHWSKIKENSSELFARGSAHGLSKLSEKDILEIRSLFGTLSYTKIGAKFNVSKGTIKDIAAGRTWSHVK